MKKKYLAGIAALAMSLSMLTACGNDSSADSAASVAEAVTTEATTATTAETTTETAETTTETTAASDAEEDLGLDMEGLIHQIDVPEYKTVSAEKPEVFDGNWEAEVIISEGTAYDEMLGIPVGAMMHLVIDTAKNEATIINISAPDDSTDKVEEDDSIGTTTFEDGMLKVIEPDEDEDGNEIEGQTVTTCMSLTEDGKMVLYMEDGEDGVIIFKKVDQFTAFDWDAYAKSLEDAFAVTDEDTAAAEEDADSDDDADSEDGADSEDE